MNTENEFSLKRKHRDGSSNSSDTDSLEDTSIERKRVKYIDGLDSDSLSSESNDTTTTTTNSKTPFCDRLSPESKITDASLMQDLEMEEDTLNRSPYYSTCLKCAKARSGYFRYCSDCYRVIKFHMPARKSKKTGLNASVSSGYGSLIDPEVPKGLLGDTSVQELCNICMINTKDAGFFHKKIIHVYACYKCSVKTYKHTGRCPVCNLKCTQIYKMI